MTKEEYEKLLMSDYWKGFSYSLIKERNFTCEDCGRTFYNQRNKLQVHHLVYRDINPWSYKPEEMVVLCEDCHRKRHGLYVYEPADDSYKEKGYALLLNIWYKLKYWLRNKRFRKWFVLLVVVCGLLLYAKLNDSKQANEQEETEISTDRADINKKDVKEKPKKKKKKTNRNKEDVNRKREKSNVDIKEEEVIDIEKNIPETTVAEPVEMQEMTKKEAKKHAKAVKKAIKAGVSTEGTTEEILERIKQAKADRKKRATDEVQEVE